MSKKLGGNYDYGVSAPRETGLGQFLKEHFGSISGVVLGDGDSFVSLSVKRRGEADFMAILKRETASGDAEVCFGSGTTFVNVLAGLDAAVSAGKWRADKPWNGNGHLQAS